ncbi:MAG TPA: DedA family protein [Longimicrobiales bacterium]|nr:DedA family protein [Longimicrobiales bacterium]
MDWILAVIDFILHIDVHLDEIIRAYGTWTYSLLFLIVFAETGLVVTPFLPGDSLLFAAGAFAARGSLEVWTLFFALTIAAILGDSINYSIGRYLAPRMEQGIGFIKQKHLDRTHAFYEKHGGKTIVIARFMPIVRTFAPFVAGVGAMNYRRFLAFNVGGALLWVSIFVFGGYYFGNIPAVKENFTLMIVAIILVSVMPGVVEYVRHRARNPRAGLPEES